MKNTKSRNHRSYSLLIAGTLAAAAMPLLGTVAVAQGPTPTPPNPILEYRFNNDPSATVAANTGSDQSTDATTGAKNSQLNFVQNVSGIVQNGQALHSAATTAVNSGPAGVGDVAFNLTGSTGMGANGTGPFGGQFVGDAAVQNLSSFTVAGWFKTDGTEVLGSGARLMDYTSTAAGFAVIGVTNSSVPGFLQLNVNSSGSVGSLVTPTALYGTPTDVGNWVFYAVSYDGTSASNNVTFYKGTQTTSVLPVFTGTLNEGKVVTPTAGQFFEIGNNTITSNRQFDGYMDDFRLYGSTSNDNTGVVGLSQLEALRQADIAAAPEPSGLIGIALGAMSLGGLALRRKMRATA